jgi:ethanolamine permease
MISYTLQGLSFILLRLNPLGIPRPYLYCQFRDPAYVKGVYAALAWYVAGLAYLGLFGRHRLVLSPEEQFAISKGASVEQAGSTSDATVLSSTGA